LLTSQRINGMIFEMYNSALEFNASVSPTSPYPLNRIETPVLVFNALDDSIAIPENVSRLANQMPNARLNVVPNGGHLLFGHSEEVKSEITKFLHNKLVKVSGAANI
jgi:pimeloyl-ACP methyl ester carboxylesterase